MILYDFFPLRADLAEVAEPAGPFIFSEGKILLSGRIGRWVHQHLEHPLGTTGDVVFDEVHLGGDHGIGLVTARIDVALHHLDLVEGDLKMLVGKKSITRELDPAIHVFTLARLPVQDPDSLVIFITKVDLDDYFKFLSKISSIKNCVLGGISFFRD